MLQADAKRKHMKTPLSCKHTGLHLGNICFPHFLFISHLLQTLYVQQSAQHNSHIYFLSNDLKREIQDFFTLDDQ